MSNPVLILFIAGIYYALDIKCIYTDYLPRLAALESNFSVLDSDGMQIHAGFTGWKSLSNVPDTLYIMT